jgi:hypothetical protein
MTKQTFLSFYGATPPVCRVSRWIRNLRFVQLNHLLKTPLRALKLSSSPAFRLSQEAGVTPSIGRN